MKTVNLILTKIDDLAPPSECKYIHSNVTLLCDLVALAMLQCEK